MDKASENIIYLKASKSLESINQSIRILQEFLQEGGSSGPSKVYLARNFLRKGEAFYQEALEKAKKLLGPMPEYATEDLKKWRAEMLEKNNVLAKSQKLRDLCKELKNDDLVRKLVSPKEINTLVRKHFQDQKEGIRKLSNIKVRIILDGLKGYILQVQELLKETMEIQKENV